MVKVSRKWSRYLRLRRKQSWLLIINNCIPIKCSSGCVRVKISQLPMKQTSFSPTQSNIEFRVLDTVFSHYLRNTLTTVPQIMISESVHWPVDDDWDGQCEDEDSHEGAQPAQHLQLPGLSLATIHRNTEMMQYTVSPLPTHLASPAVRALVPDAHRGEHHQAPPEALREAPAGFWVTLRKVN